MVPFLFVEKGRDVETESLRDHYQRISRLARDWRPEMLRILEDYPRLVEEVQRLKAEKQEAA